MPSLGVKTRSAPPRASSLKSRASARSLSGRPTAVRAVRLGIRDWPTCRMLGSHGQRGNAEVGWAKVGVWTARHLVLLDPTVHVCRRLAAWSGSGLTCLERCSLALVLVVGLSPQISGAANYEDIASQAGLRVPVTFGNATESNYILETTGTGAAIFDFDRDGDSDIFVVNGTTFPLAQAGKSPPLMLYVNDGRGRFTESALETGLAARGWGQGACVGDFDNDGWD
ncbi:MAG: VCBS repeat-containing protein, partial [Acidobacteriia bacterium]|nr:VCBS repeat-containing protein [Terriglobia bacterium]